MPIYFYRKCESRSLILLNLNFSRIVSSVGMSILNGEL
ncbi:hypothetical protein IEI_02919 [Bacillus wiedmannii]|nr:hypothetical protein IEI_02919 [Bacillus wiedmannii]